jgi:hypothetical protein
MFGAQLLHALVYHVVPLRNGEAGVPNITNPAASRLAQLRLVTAILRHVPMPAVDRGADFMLYSLRGAAAAAGIAPPYMHRLPWLDGQHPENAIATAYLYWVLHIGANTADRPTRCLAAAVLGTLHEFNLHPFERQSVNPDRHAAGLALKVSDRTIGELL